MSRRSAEYIGNLIMTVGRCQDLVGGVVDGRPVTQYLQEIHDLTSDTGNLQLQTLFVRTVTEKLLNHGRSDDTARRSAHDGQVEAIRPLDRPLGRIAC